MITTRAFALCPHRLRLRRRRFVRFFAIFLVAASLGVVFVILLCQFLRARKQCLHGECSRRIRREKNLLYFRLNQLHDGFLVQKVHLLFRGMHVDVDVFKRQAEVHEYKRLLSLGEYRRVHRLTRALERRALH